MHKTTTRTTVIYCRNFKYGIKRTNIFKILFPQPGQSFSNLFTNKKEPYCLFCIVLMSNRVSPVTFGFIQINQLFSYADYNH